MKKLGMYCLLFGMFIMPHFLVAQDEQNDVVVLDDGFHDLFFEALLQKGIENYDKAIETLDKCKNIQPDNAVTYFELGKNYLAQKVIRFWVKCSNIKWPFDVLFELSEYILEKTTYIYFQKMDLSEAHLYFLIVVGNFEIS